MPAFVLRSKSIASVAIVLALFLAGPASAQTGPHKGNLHGVFIGVNNARSQEFVNGPAENARAQADFWAAQGGTLYNRANMAAPLTNENATRQAILAELDRLVEAGQAGDTAVVYICAHGGVVGTGPRKDVYVFAAYDGDVHAAELRERLEALARKGVRVLLILETCHAGGFEVQGDNIIVLAACTAEQTTPAAGNRGECAPFTQVLLAGLQGAADANHDGVVTLAELNAYVAEQMEKVSSKVRHSVCPGCTASSNVPLNLKLAAVVTPPARPGNGGGTGPIQPQR
jgi:hypothetical protein